MTIKNLSYGITVLALGGVLLAPSPAPANFSGAYDVTNWTTTLTGSPPAGGGTMDTSLAPSSIAIMGGGQWVCGRMPTRLHDCGCRDRLRELRLGL